MFKVDDFNVCDINTNGHFVRIEELNKMIEKGVLIVNYEKLDEYKQKTERVCGVMAELKPCPFCGSEARLYVGQTDDHGVACTKCSVKVYGHTSKEKAIESWNRRASDGNV